MRKPRNRWLATIAVVTVGLLVYALEADAANFAMVRNALVHTAKRPLRLDCTYAARKGEAISYPDGIPDVYVKATWCGQARAFARRPNVVMARQAADAMLILTHEALHIRLWHGARDERLTECAAIEEVDDFARYLGASPAVAKVVQDAARPFHDAYLAEHGWTC